MGEGGFADPGSDAFRSQTHRSPAQERSERRHHENAIGIRLFNGIQVRPRLLSGATQETGRVAPTRLKLAGLESYDKL